MLIAALLSITLVVFVTIVHGFCIIRVARMITHISIIRDEFFSGRIET
jgi:hypothetical protein